MTPLPILDSDFCVGCSRRTDSGVTINADFEGHLSFLELLDLSEAETKVHVAQLYCNEGIVDPDVPLAARHAICERCAAHLI